VSSISIKGYEADDIMATLATKAAKFGQKVCPNYFGIIFSFPLLWLILGKLLICILPSQVVIMSQDKDMYQLIGNGVEMYDPVKETVIGMFV